MSYQSILRCPIPGTIGEDNVLYAFQMIRYRLGMSDIANRRPATPDEIVDALSFALRYQGRKRVNDADDMMARITADRLVSHLTASGFLLMKAGTAAAPTTSQMPSAEREQESPTMSDHP